MIGVVGASGVKQPAPKRGCQLFSLNKPDVDGHRYLLNLHPQQHLRCLRVLVLSRVSYVAAVKNDNIRKKPARVRP